MSFKFTRLGKYLFGQSYTDVTTSIKDGVKFMFKNSLICLFALGFM